MGSFINTKSEITDKFEAHLHSSNPLYDNFVNDYDELLIMGHSIIADKDIFDFIFKNNPTIVKIVYYKYECQSDKDINEVKAIFLEFDVETKKYYK